MCGQAKRPTVDSIASDIRQLTMKKAARFARMKSFSSCCSTSAIGGPPIEELVPINPERNPAENMAGAVGRNMIFARLRPTATITESPSHRASERWSIHSNRKPPATVPGMRPRMANFKPANDMDFQNFAALATDRVKAQIVIGAGTYRGSMKYNNGAAMIARPKPMELCT